MTEEQILEVVMKLAKAIAGDLPIAEEIASQLRKDYDVLYNSAGYPYGDSLEGLYQYICNTKVEVEGED